jgi:hypothetical protein
MRRGQYTLGHKWLYFIVAIFLLGTMFLGLRTTFISYQTESVTCISNTFDEIMIAKILYSPGCFTYIDEEINKPVPGTIDMKRFNNETLNQCFKFITKKVHLRIDDKSIGDQIFTPKIVKKPIYTYNDGKVTPNTLEFTFVEPAC